MARHKFALNQEPHVAEIGDNITLEFHPEVMGDAYLDAWERLQDAYRSLGLDPSDTAALEKAGADAVRRLNTSMRVFLAGLMLPESAKKYAWWEARDGSDTVVYEGGDPDEAARVAEQTGGTVTDVGLKLPDRVHVELMQWIGEVYGQRPTGSSGGSAPASPPRGRRGTASSRSKA